MPEFYAGTDCKYQKKAQPYLDAIARGVRDSAEARAFLLSGTEHSAAYEGARPLWQEQWRARDPGNAMKGAFWSNYWYEPCASCDCRIDESVSMEVDAVFFLENPSGRKIAIHVEMKRDDETESSHGQFEAYRPRAACYRDRRRVRKHVLPHDDFAVVLFHGSHTDLDLASRCFDRVISHASAREAFPGYPAG